MMKKKRYAKLNQPPTAEFAIKVISWTIFAGLALLLFSLTITG
jgi:hypothetical protein